MKTLITIAALITMSLTASAQSPQIETGVSQELAKWRAARYSDVRYKLNLTLEKMSPVLKGTMEIRVRVSGGVEEKGSGGEKPGTQAPSPASPPRGEVPPIILDWRKIKGHEEKSTISKVTINGTSVDVYGPEAYHLDTIVRPFVIADQEHLIFRDGVVAGENVINLDFTSPILTSGSAITRYIDKEDGSEYIYSLFVPSDASTAFPVFDQPDLKARFELAVQAPESWQVISNGVAEPPLYMGKPLGWERMLCPASGCPPGYVPPEPPANFLFEITKPISTYVFAFAAGPWEKVSMAGAAATGSSADGQITTPSRERRVPPLLRQGGERHVFLPSWFEEGWRPLRPTGWSASRVTTDNATAKAPPATAGGTDKIEPQTFIYVRKSQAAKFKPHAAEVFRLNREAVKYFEQYFDYKFPFPKYDLVLIPEFPFGGMEHAGATFLRESSIIFPQEPTKNDHISRATLIFHEAAHQWFGDTVTMRWFDDLWLKEGFATFTAYKAMERIMPEMNSWKVFYERIKQGAYQTDSTRGTTAIYQPIANLSAAKSAYGNIVYNKAPAFLRQAEFYLGEDKFQTAVRAFLKKHEFGNAGWEDLVTEFETASKKDLKNWASAWVTKPGVTLYRIQRMEKTGSPRDWLTWLIASPREIDGNKILRPMAIQLQSAFVLPNFASTFPAQTDRIIVNGDKDQQIYLSTASGSSWEKYFVPNYGDYGYGIFLLDEKSRNYVLKNIQNEKDPFLRTMMWGALWDSVREDELDPRVFVELVVKVLGGAGAENHPVAAAATPLLRKEGRKEMQKPAREQGRNVQPGDYALAHAQASSEEDESTVATLLGRTGTALNYYIDEAGTQAPSPASAQRAETSVTNGTQRPVDAVQAGRLRSQGDLRSRVEDMLIDRMRNAPTLGQRITYYRAFLNIASSETALRELRKLLFVQSTIRPPDSVAHRSGMETLLSPSERIPRKLKFGTPEAPFELKTKDKFDIVTRLISSGYVHGIHLLNELEKIETSDEAKRYAYAARAAIPTRENKAKYWNDFVNNKDISESWIEGAFGPWNSIRHSELTLPYLQKALQELPNHKRNRKIFFVNGWLGAFLSGQRSEEALGIVNKFLADNPKLDNDLRLKILENVDVIERAVRIRSRFKN